jgi:hypothetical protein
MLVRWTPPFPLCRPSNRLILVKGKRDAVLLVSVIDGKAFAEFDGCGAYDMIHIGVIGWGAAEDLNTYGALFDLLGGPPESLFDDVTEKLDRPLAGTEDVILDKQLQLFTNLLIAQFGSRSMFNFSSEHIDSNDEDSSIQI